jgi:hypothetical protein
MDFSIDTCIPKINNPTIKMYIIIIIIIWIKAFQHPERRWWGLKFMIINLVSNLYALSLSWTAKVVL